MHIRNAPLNAKANSASYPSSIAKMQYQLRRVQHRQVCTVRSFPFANKRMYD